MAASTLAASAFSSAVGSGANSASQCEQNFTESPTSRPQLQHFIADSPKALISKAKNVFHHTKIRILFALAFD
jgi:hypothetical protein